MSKNKYQKIANSRFEKLINQEKQSAVLVFSAVWSGNAELMDSIIERICVEFDNDISFFKIDIEEQVKIARFFGVSTVPTVILLKDGEMVDLIKRLIPAKKLRLKIKEAYQV